MANNKNNLTPRIAPPAATGNAGPHFEAEVGAYYLLSLLASGETRGLPEATPGRVQLQQAAGYPLDDVVVRAISADGSPAVLEIQAKRTLDFTASDEEFADVVRRMWVAAQKPEFKTSRYAPIKIARRSRAADQIGRQVRAQLLQNLLLAGMILADGESHHLVEVQFARPIEVHQLPADGAQSKALTHHLGGNTEPRGDLLGAESPLLLDRLSLGERQHGETPAFSDGD